MATIPYWLQRQRKPDLQDLAAHVGLNGYDKLLKPDLEIILNDHLRKHASQLQNDAKLSGYYKNMRRGDSPVKRESGGLEEKKPKSRRQTLKARGELEGMSSDADTPHNALTPAQPPCTPPPSTSLALTNPLPTASPSLLADAIEHQTASLTTTLSTTLHTTRVPALATWLRSTLSSTPAIQILVITIELWGLLATIMPLRCAGTVHVGGWMGLGLGEEEGVSVRVPDMFALVTWGFWGPFLVWLATSVLVPETAAWVINLRRAGRREGEGSDAGTPSDDTAFTASDPVTWGVVKALVAWIVYMKTPLAVVRGESFGVVAASVPGGGVGMVVGAGVCVLGGVYEAVLRR